MSRVSARRWASRSTVGSRVQTLSTRPGASGSARAAGGHRGTHLSASPAPQSTDRMNAEGAHPHQSDDVTQANRLLNKVRGAKLIDDLKKLEDGRRRARLL